MFAYEVIALVTAGAGFIVACWAKLTGERRLTRPALFLTAVMGWLAFGGPVVDLRELLVSATFGLWVAVGWLLLALHRRRQDEESALQVYVQAGGNRPFRRTERGQRRDGAAA